MTDISIATAYLDGCYGIIMVGLQRSMVADLRCLYTVDLDPVRFIHLLGSSVLSDTAFCVCIIYTILTREPRTQREIGYLECYRRVERRGLPDRAGPTSQSSRLHRQHRLLNQQGCLRLQAFHATRSAARKACDTRPEMLILHV